MSAETAAWGYGRDMRLLLILALVLLPAALVLQAVLDSSLAAWAAMGTLFALALVKLASVVGIWPADWPDIFGGGD